MKWWNELKQDLANAHKSVTIWVNGVVAVGASVLIYLADNTDALAPVQDLAPQAYKYAVIVLGVYNAYRRFKTTTALRDK